MEGTKLWLDQNRTLNFGLKMRFQTNKCIIRYYFNVKGIRLNIGDYNALCLEYINYEYVLEAIFCSF